ncbi:MAG: ribbon-helix-helix protein, CopG family [Coriobacteriia bacterium]|nr:ribbon-helix-helix protein, CopG family [Coriobacteriia bacterium]
MGKVNVSLPDELLETVDALALELDRSRSSIVAEATAQYVVRVAEEREREHRRSSIEAAMTDARELAGRVPAGGDTTMAIRRDRDRDYGNGPADA